MNTERVSKVKKIKCSAVIAVLFIGVLLNITGCQLMGVQTTDVLTDISNILEVDVSDGVVIYQYDDHGGFLGDGDMVVKLSFSDTDCLNRIKESSAWKPLPLTKNLEAFVYGATYYGCYNAPYIHDSDYNPVVPKIENGYYCFVDRHSRSKDKKDDSPLLNRYSINCSLAIYDTDTNLLYYLELDT